MSAEAHPLLEFDRPVELHAIGAEGRDRLLVPVPDLGAATDVVVEREVAWVGGAAGADVQVLLAVAAALDVAHADDVAGVAVGGVAVRGTSAGDDRPAGGVGGGARHRGDHGGRKRGDDNGARGALTLRGAFGCPTSEGHRAWARIGCIRSSAPRSRRDTCI